VWVRVLCVIVEWSAVHDARLLATVTDWRRPILAYCTCSVAQYVYLTWWFLTGISRVKQAVEHCSLVPSYTCWTASAHPASRRWHCLLALPVSFCRIADVVLPGNVKGICWGIASPLKRGFLFNLTHPTTASVFARFDHYVSCVVAYVAFVALNGKFASAVCCTLPGACTGDEWRFENSQRLRLTGSPAVARIADRTGC